MSLMESLAGSLGRQFGKAKKAYNALEKSISSPLTVDRPGQDSSSPLKVHYSLGLSKSPPYVFEELMLEDEDGKTDLIEEAGKLSTEGKEKAQEVGERLKASLGDLSGELEELASNPSSGFSRLVSDPSHPVSAAILSALAILAAELSGFAVFAALTTLVGTLVLSPVGWFAVPLMLLLALAYKDRLTGETASKVNSQLQELDEKREHGELDEETYQAKRKRIIKDHFS